MDLSKAHDIASIGTFVLTVIIVALTAWMVVHPEPAPASHAALPADSAHKSEPGISAESSRPMWQVLVIRWIMPSALVLSLLGAAFIHLKAAKLEQEARAPKRDTDKAKSSLHPPYAPELGKGDRVRIIDLSALSEMQKNRSPSWVSAMDKYAGREYTVESISADGWLKLEGIDYDFHRDWVTR